MEAREKGMLETSVGSDAMSSRKSPRLLVEDLRMSVDPDSVV